MYVFIVSFSINYPNEIVSSEVDGILIVKTLIIVV